MIEKLKQIYRNKIIENVKEYNYEKYYYFYLTNQTDIFGIEKTITLNEYELIKTNYIEKKIYDNNPKKQSIYEYIFDNQSYPFSSNKVKVIVIDPNKQKQIEPNTLKDILLNFYQEVKFIQLDNLFIAFCEKSYDLEINNYISSINFDLGINIKLHDGIYLNNIIKGNDLLKYLNIVKQYLNNHEENYSFYLTILLDNYQKDYANFLEQTVLKVIFNDSLVKDMIITYFKNDLNVSKTAKDLYINRNSLLNKFDYIQKETGINLQKFNHACSIYLLTISKGQTN